MNKTNKSNWKLIALIIGILSITIVSAVVLGDYQTALSYLRTVKSDRETNITSSVNNLKYATDKICVLDYDTELPKCYVIVNYTMNGESKQIAVFLNENSTLAEDNAMVKNSITQRLQRDYPKEPVEYTASARAGGKI